MGFGGVSVVRRIIETVGIDVAVGGEDNVSTLQDMRVNDRSMINEGIIFRRNIWFSVTEEWIHSQDDNDYNTILGKCCIYDIM